jgi:hypothetical protein
MSSHIRSTKGTDTVQQKGYSITPVRPTFTDWNGGQAVAHKPENRRDDVLLDRPTMEMGNETKIGYNEKKHFPPSESVVVCGKNIFERFRAHGRDTWWQYRDDSTISKDVIADYKTYLIYAFSGEVGLNSLQRHRAFRQFMELDLKRGTGRTVVNAFIICALVANDDSEKYGLDSEKVYHPQRSDDNNDKGFRRLEKAMRHRFPTVTKSFLTKVYNKLSQGNPPTRQQSKWKEQVKRESDIPQNPSFASEQYEPQSDGEQDM